jgi:hypothetical protein
LESKAPLRFTPGCLHSLVERSGVEGSAGLLKRTALRKVFATTVSRRHWHHLILAATAIHNAIGSTQAAPVLTGAFSAFSFAFEAGGRGHFAPRSRLHRLAI